MICRYCVLVVLIGFSNVHYATGYDSLRMEKIKGKMYIIHRVESSETLYSISRKYNVSVKDIQKANKGLKNGIKIFQEIKIPYIEPEPIVIDKPSEKPTTKQTGKFHIVQKGETLYSISRLHEVSIDSIMSVNQLIDNTISLGDSLLIPSKSSTPKLNKLPIPATTQAREHIVGPSETLYGISRKYGFSIEELKSLNELTSNEISIGQKLMIVRPDSMEQKTDTVQLTVKSTLPEQSEASSVQKSQPVADTIHVKSDTSRFKTKIEKIGNVEKTWEQGFAMKIDGTAGTKKFLVLHRTAPIGTIIEVTNKMNNQKIVARVVGKLPETGINKSVLIRLSNSAYEKLGAIDTRFPVEVGYVID